MYPMSSKCGSHFLLILPILNPFYDFQRAGEVTVDLLYLRNQKITGKDMVHQRVLYIHQALPSHGAANNIS